MPRNGLASLGRTIYRYSLALDAGVTLGIEDIDPETGEAITDASR